MNRTSIRRTILGLTVAGAVALTGCGSDDAGGSDVPGTYTHVEEGTIVLEDDGDGTITQSGDPVPFEYEVDGNRVLLSFDGEVRAVATIRGDTLTFRTGDFSGDEPVVFTKS